MAGEEGFEQLVQTARKAGAALRDADVPYALGGGLAAWVRGGPETEHDADLLVKPEDAERALAALEEAGFRPERPLEDWLLKAYDDDVLVDLIFNPASGPIDDEILRRAETLEVLALPMPVAALDQLPRALRRDLTGAVPAEPLLYRDGREAGTEELPRSSHVARSPVTSRTGQSQVPHSAALIPVSPTRTPLKRRFRHDCPETVWFSTPSGTPARACIATRSAASQPSSRNAVYSVQRSWTTYSQAGSSRSGTRELKSQPLPAP